MTDIPPPAPSVSPAPLPAITTTPSEVEARTWTIIIYGMYLAAAPSGGFTGIVGVIMAYIKREEFRGTIWESHAENAIRAFWIWFLLCLVGAPLVLLFGLGVLVMFGAFVYFLFRTIKGLIAAIDGKPYV
jgi:uncharacterized membrane protein